MEFDIVDNYNTSLPKKNVDTTNLFELKCLSKKNLNRVLFESIQNGDMRRFRRSFSLLGDINSSQFFDFKERLITMCRIYGSWNMLIIIDPTYFSRREQEERIREEKSIRNEEYLKTAIFPLYYVSISQEERRKMAETPRDLIINQLRF